MRLVQKFGGTSVADLDRINKVADKVVASHQAGHDVVVVLSAMAGETDRLIELHKSITEHPDDRDYSMLVSTGELITVSLMSMAIKSRGVEARCYTGGQAGIKTSNGELRKARIDRLECDRLKDDLSQRVIPVVAGFQGTDVFGNVSTLGRGGSDTSAVAIAVGIEADECQIFTDVAGVYTTDPRVVSAARLLSHVTFEEMLELASLGSKVLQIRSVEFAGKHNMPLRVLSSFVDGQGTLITYEESAMEQAIVSGIAFNRSEAKITILGLPNQPGVEGKILQPISEANIDIDVIVQNATSSQSERKDFTFTVHRDDYKAALDIARHVCDSVGAEKVDSDLQIVKVSLVGVGMRSHPGVASKMFNVLGKERIGIHLVTTSEIKISVVIDEKYLELGVRALHSAFGLDKEPSEEFDPGTAPK